jgi:glucose/arabinose dehydrogenase
MPVPTHRAPVTNTSPRTIVTGLHVPWGIVFLSDGSALVGERTTGRIMRIPRGGGTAHVAMQVPGVNFDGEGGLLGLALSPSYRSDHLIYAYVTTSSDNRIVRFTLGGALHPILTGIAHASIHNGGRIAFGPDGKLYAGVGDAGNTSNAQNLNSLNGKILRINSNGTVPSDNPFGTPVWTYGHRNVQGLSWDSAGRLWATEFGQNTYDEVNLIVKGHNYGWPNVEGTGSTSGGKYTNPKVTWRTDQASPSGDAVVGSSLFVAALRGQCLWVVPLHGSSVSSPHRTLTGYGRLRTVVRAPDGSLWVMTSNRDGRGSPRSGDDRIIRIPL